jgi:hypothetical protein
MKEISAPNFLTKTSKYGKPIIVVPVTLILSSFGDGSFLPDGRTVL